MIPTEEINRISIEVSFGRQPARPDTPEEAAFRANLIAEHKAKADDPAFQDTVFDCVQE